jgi:hypothetical protein
MTLFGVCGRPGKVALGRYAGVRNWNADADATERDALERLRLERLLLGNSFTLADTPTELDCPDAMHRLKITELGATRNADTNLYSLTPLLLPAHLCSTTDRARRTDVLNRCFVATPGRKIGESEKSD